MRGIGRGQLVRLGTPGERYEELCGQCWKGKLCVTSSGAMFPCPLSQATDVGDVKSGLSGILANREADRVPPQGSFDAGTARQAAHGFGKGEGRRLFLLAR
jgi:hypothetical protein